jgi:DNA-binding GntR family transcriptional regulator
MARAAEQAYQSILERISDGTYAAGTRLREEELAEQVGVSRTPIREALRRLAGDGLIEFSPNRGAQVSSWSAREMEEIFGLRALLEGHAARLAAARIEPAELERLAELAREMDDLAAKGTGKALDRLAMLNTEFHQLVISAARSARLAELVTGLIQTALVHRTFRRYGPDHLRRSMDHHRELVSALRRRNPPWAEAVMRSHILSALDVVLESPPASS